MKFKTWLDEERGRATALAAHLNLTAGRVSQMAEAGVPQKYMLAVRDFTDNAVTLEDMALARAAGAGVAPEAPTPAGA